MGAHAADPQKREEECKGPSWWPFFKPKNCKKTNPLPLVVKTPKPLVISIPFQRAYILETILKHWGLFVIRGKPWHT